LKREAPALNEGDRNILSDFRIVIAMHAILGMIESLNDHRGTVEDCGGPVHLVSINLARMCKKMSGKFSSIEIENRR
jgi:hypothetical protein